MGSVSTPPGRREANKAATREALLAAATRLFAEQGFEATTIAEIARAAQVGQRTFYRYFDGKEELLADQVLGWIDELREAIRTRPAAERPYRAVAAALADAVAHADAPLSALLTERPRPLATLRQATPRPLRRMEWSIAAAVLARTGDTDADRLAARVLAAAAAAALRVAVLEHREQTRAGRSVPLARQLTAAFDALASLTAG